MRSPTLRTQMFRSHLVVMVVAVSVMVAAAIGLAILFELINDGPITLDARDWRRGSRGGTGALALLGIALAAVVAASLVGLHMARRLAEPMERLGRATREIAGGNYNVAVAASGVEELDRLGEDVQTLATALAETEARRLRLIGDIAHELRTPLSTIEGSMEALMDGVLPAEDETFAGVAREAARLRRLAGDMSALSASAEHNPLADAAIVDVASLAYDVVDLLRVQADAKDVVVHIDGSDAGPVLGDADRLTQVLTNVIGNAIQYTDEGRVDVQVVRRKAEVIVEVADTGQGLPPGDLGRVFDRFYRVDEDFAGGTGVGLTIAQQITRAHGGSIEATSPGPGLGSTFTIRLPAA